MVTVASGCTAESQPDQANHNVESGGLSQHYKSNLARADAFWTLYEQGLKNYESGQYEQAISLYKKALNEYATSKPTQSAAM